MNRKEILTKYFDATRNSPPSQLLISALPLAEKGVALDLGAGAGRDTRYLVSQGFSVVSVDAFPDFVNEVGSYCLTLVYTFDTFPFPVDFFSVINAHYSLPFNSPDTFKKMFVRLVYSLRNDGVFAGQFFGKNDSWNVPYSNMTFHSREEVESLLKDFSIIQMTEEEKDEESALGEMKHWHVFNVIAKKK